MIKRIQTGDTIMYKKLIAVWLCLNLVCPVLAADPFAEDNTVNVEKSTSESNLETADITVKEEVKEESADNKETSEEAKQVDYTVVSGDYLSSIAARYLGDGDRWPEIVELNKDKYPSLSSNPNLIYPGWVLTLPSGSTAPGSTTASNPSNGSTSNVSYQGTESASLAAYTGGKLPPSEFISLFGPVARDSLKATGVPASVTLAQAILETGWGQCSIGDAKNLFGIKGTGPAGTTVVHTQECYNGTFVTIQDGFRKYNSWQESIDDHAKLVSGWIYKPAWDAYQANHDADAFARGIHQAGYATDPEYANKLISLMQSYNLYEWDQI